mmetsp:Transcript_4342/g.6093  ORF Transcript_4342/g.6093 Transcript_4342/m.6093 type:complete len:198 (-) Transcript_4342:52-645(-)|eukprot:CAMPEP_0171463596 /NCGR_PEP_ID=MMETSP0945-20130129/7209_1 /TAXON_ID=109269 /ORGANISM="Vaucheria litorea, Strain CCMP2940" /LENGTH=197 /DNA_ID=CAMNT_0011990431 /DNA_START=30 /DNA_END=623 /DNA_ORIENTATION=-
MIAFLDNLNEYQYHGVFMALAWLVIVPLAIISSRYTRCFVGWFYLHATLQIAALGVTIYSFYLALKLPSVQGEHFSSTHGQLGLAILTIMTLQILYALFRPSFDKEAGKSHRRVFWESNHKIVGFLLMLLAFYNVHEGMEVDEAETTDSQNIWYMIIVASIFGLFFVLELAKCFCFKSQAKSDDAFSQRVVNYGTDA